ncbi:uncharacterized protein J3D65DRAFT_624775 [Phyllosticta citribraziliensis]|uniref:Uncharacterized protein n=1 Tax=Phyllosticta citribraziliensis TaxID=989973 RepID=A0ABR1LRA5_9PEZI
MVLVSGVVAVLAVASVAFASRLGGFAWLWAWWRAVLGLLCWWACMAAAAAVMGVSGSCAERGTGEDESVPRR